MTRYVGLMQALEDFSAAAIKIQEGWDMLDGEEMEMGNYKYPFEQSFDDVVCNIIEWRHEFTDSLNQADEEAEEKEAEDKLQYEINKSIDRIKDGDY